MLKGIYQLWIILLFVSCQSNSSTEETNDNSSDNQIKESQQNNKTEKRIVNHKIGNYYFDPDTSIVSGRLVIRKFLGPPGWGETPKIDAHYSFYFLKLPKLIKVLPADTKWDEIDSVSEIQLIYIEKDTKDDTLRRYLNHNVHIKGILQGRDGTPSEFTKVIMETGSILKR